MKRHINNFISRFRYGLKIGKGAYVHRSTQFNGANLIGEGIIVSGSNIGYASYIASNSLIQNTKIGSFTCIGDQVRTGMGRHPVNEFISVHPAFYSEKKLVGFTFSQCQRFDEHLFADDEKNYYVVIGSDVWIGNNVIIMDGITIADGAIVAAGAVVTKSVEPYTVVGGVPAKIIKKRFADDEIDSLLRIRWWDKNPSWIKANAANFSSFESFNNITSN